MGYGQMDMYLDMASDHYALDATRLTTVNAVCYGFI